ncbi:sulfotransferase family 2 domain-containing protein [Primorskyibacter flagellatus]|uniref:Sulfotransferase family protein n=1 Tax=Primorskyibacter flagellatus TaxID=1387277 RepID=A0A1W2EN64_9RHOB|nr:sulfotransferase family 2 domain-containing protein [Primorskyibacter flagellatus]SMD10726.1 Sulfotransferase family protein [Primorskyibacter flagellatus]
MFSVSQGQVAQFVKSNSDPETVWFLHHIPKTAGSSLVAEIVLGVGEDNYVNLEGNYSSVDSYIDSLAALTDQAIDLVNGPNAPRILSGHLRAGNIEHLVQSSPQLKMLSFVRHPVSRVVSEYNYCCTPLHPLHKEFMITYPTIYDYIEDPKEMNKIGRMMFGPTPITPKEAVERMVGRYTMIGMQERYPASFLMMSSMLWEPTLPHKQERIGAAKKLPSGDVAQRIADANEIDLALYAHVEKVYEDITPEIWDDLSPARPVST